MKKNMHETEEKMFRDEIQDRPCSPTESLEQSLKEMQAMRQNKMEKRTWRELKKELDGK